ncbi:ABC transporter ATP-binding protein [Clostridium boliviensis]|uniref:ABC transporter ATP-binding protein n=1 Tax=Clostridium boliviensis TaxID=318465 RepID=A0ABU4GKI4_9CLOT|nr:ABC transporter ATP-binding protein [Clostridium boliviensis]MDW2796782.1 ABC transporter ATP-binding protein [Clostridium boliviensis]
MLKMEGVSFSYHRSKPTIKDLDLSVEMGKITTIVGPNGCGKSTVLKLASGLLKPQTGRILLNGENISYLSRRSAAKQVSVLFQNSQIPDMTALCAVEAARYPYQSPFAGCTKEEKEMSEYAMELTGCKEYWHKHMAELSGGERQRVFLAMIYNQDTPLILLDEPTTYLDIYVTYEIMELIRYLNKRKKKTVVMVLHDLNLALQYSDSVILMNQGRIFNIHSTGDDQILESIRTLFGVEVRSFRDNQNSYYCFAQSVDNDKIILD